MAAPGFGSKARDKHSLKYLISVNLVTFVLLALLTLIPKLLYGSTLFFQNSLFAAKSYGITLAILQVAKFRLLNTSTVMMSTILKSAVIMVLSVFAYHIVAILFGAAFTENMAETFHFASLLSVVTTLPCLCVIGLNMDSWKRLFELNSPETLLETEVYITTVCSLIGAWLGAVPIPLDWDRWWQEWPITCLIGTLLGYENGLLIATGVAIYTTRKWKSKLF